MANDSTIANKPGLRPVQQLSGDDNLSTFDCGVTPLNEWLARFALSDQRARSSATYLLKRGSRVVGFYTLAPHAIEPVVADTRLKAGLPRQRAVPVFLLARLALDRSEHGTGLGADLLKDALARCATVASEVGGRAVVVDAKDGSGARFYQRFGFTPLPGNPHMLYLLMKDLQTSIIRGGTVGG